MATATATADLDVSEGVLEDREGRLLRGRFDMRAESGKAVISDLIQKLREEDEEGNRQTIRQLRWIRAFRGSGIFLAAVIERGKIATEGRTWLEIIRDAIQWLLSEEGRDLIYEIIELVVMIMSMIMGSL